MMGNGIKRRHVLQDSVKVGFCKTVFNRRDTQMSGAEPDTQTYNG